MDRNHRTWLCSILFLDIVGYSKLFVDTQVNIKEHFTDMISESLKDISEKDLILLDTGDGMAISYLGDPEDMLFVGIGLRDAFIDTSQQDELNYKVRLGINLGPVKIIEDINGNRNIIGDGINVAQRIMDFAGSNELFVSRSYFDVVSCLDTRYQKIFKYLGRRADKHIRQHAVYQVVNDKSEGYTQKEDISNHVNDIVLRSDSSIPPNFDEDALKEIYISLSDYIGPMAKIIVKKHSQKCTSLNELINSVVNEIEHEEEKKQFLDKHKY